MAVANLFGEGSGGDKINGLIEEYYAYAGENISAGGFVEFINGVSGQTEVDSSDIEISSIIDSSTGLSAVLLPNNDVFVAHSGSTYLYGVVVNVSGTTITAGSDTQLSNITYSGTCVSALLLLNGQIFIAHSYKPSTVLCLYGMICTVSGTTITHGADRKLSDVDDTALGLSTLLLPNGKVFISHGYADNVQLYAMVCTVSGTKITCGTDTQLSDNTYSGKTTSPVLLENGNVFIAHSYNQYSPLLYGMVCSISGTTITAGTDTMISNIAYDGKTISSLLLPNGNIFIAHSTSFYRLNAVIVSISSTTITAGTDVNLNATNYSGYRLSTLLLAGNDVLIMHGSDSPNCYLCGIVCTVSGMAITSGVDTQLSDIAYSGRTTEPLLVNGKILLVHSYTDDEYLYAQLFGISNNAPTNHIVETIYETQVRNSTTALADGVAKTSGAGGTATAHNQKVKVFLPH